MAALSINEILLLCIGISGNAILIIFHAVTLLAARHSHYKYVKEAIPLSFPCRNGKYLITDGGDGKMSSLINYHYKASVHTSHQTQNSMRYAVDIVKLGRNLKTAKSILSKYNESYYIYGEKIYSPMRGKVIKVVDNIDDNPPFPEKMPYNVGNHVVINEGSYYLVLGHMQKDGINAAVGDYIDRGQFLGYVGNSGLTPRSHIHMQVSKCDNNDYWSGEAIPIYFENNFIPVKNKVFNSIPIH